MKLLETFLTDGLIFSIYCVINVLAKCYIVKVSKDLSDEKVKSLSKMMSKDININLHK